MENRTQILQIGSENWLPFLEGKQKEKLAWHFLDLNDVTEASIQRVRAIPPKGTFDGVLCTDQFDSKILALLSSKIEAHSLIVDQRLEDHVSEDLKKRKLPLFMKVTDKHQVIELLKVSFFNGQGGSTFHTNVIAIHPQFSGARRLFGESFLRLTGSYDDFHDTALLSWQTNIGFINGQSRKLYLQYDHEEGVEIIFDVEILNPEGTDVLGQRSYEEADISEGIDLPYEPGFGSLSFSLRAKGKGWLEVGILHIQDSRASYGEYLLGGKRVKDVSHQDFYYYFNPGDLKPPLTVFFAGYHSGKGFEGFFKMKRTGAPFLLITDSRLEGGAFYMGSPEFEAQIVGVIQKSLADLNFSPRELILSGMSMGSFGALYYAPDFSPHAVIVGKPLVNLGDIAQNDQLVRPGGFSTSLDIQYLLAGSLSETASQALNARFWEKFDQGNYEATSFIVAYMLQDDYDGKAYAQLQAHLVTKKTSLISKGLLGRHVDHGSEVVDWFFKQHDRLLKESFGRGGENGL